MPFEFAPRQSWNTLRAATVSRNQVLNALANNVFFSICLLLSLLSVLFCLFAIRVATRITAETAVIQILTAETAVIQMRRIHYSVRVTIFVHHSIRTTILLRMTFSPADSVAARLRIRYDDSRISGKPSRQTDASARPKRSVQSPRASRYSIPFLRLPLALGRCRVYKWASRRFPGRLRKTFRQRDFAAAV